jgi:CRISPR-associated protein Cmr6
MLCHDILLDISNPTTNYVSDWREAWHPNKVQVWGKIHNQKNPRDNQSQAVHWFHGNYSPNKSIKQTVLTGKIGNIGRIWHRMYPRYVSKDGNLLNPPSHYVELLTIFPDNSATTTDFLQFLAINGFEKLNS